MEKEICCDNCGMLFVIEKLETEKYHLKKLGDVKAQYFTCPKCDEKYFIAVFDEESDRLRDELMSFIRHSDMNNRDNQNIKRSMKKDMYSYNRRLKRRFLKELRRSEHGKR